MRFLEIFLARIIMLLMICAGCAISANADEVVICADTEAYTGASPKYVYKGDNPLVIDGVLEVTWSQIYTDENFIEFWVHNPVPSQLIFKFNSDIEVSKITFVNTIDDVESFAMETENETSECFDTDVEQGTIAWKNGQNVNHVTFMRNSESDIVARFQYIVVEYSGGGGTDVPTLKSREVVFDIAKVIGFDCAGVPSQIARFEGGGNVTYSSSNERVVTVDPNTGYLTALSDGSATITAKVDATEEYAAAEGSYSVEIRLIDEEDLNKYRFEKSHYNSVQGQPVNVVLNGVDFVEDTDIEPFINGLSKDYSYDRESNQLVINKAGRYIFQAIDTKLADWPIAACLIDVFPEVNTTLSGEKIDGTPEDVILYEGAAPSLNFDMADDNDYNIVVTVDGVSGNSSSVGLYDNAEIKYAVIYGGMKQISLENTLYSVKRPEKTVVNEDGNNYIISSEAGSLLNYRIISKQSAYTAGVDAEPNWIEAQGNTLTIEPSWFGNDINAKVVVEAKAVKSTKKEGYKAEGASTQHTMIFPEALSSINELELDQDEKIEYYDIHGRRITNTAPGLYIRRTSSGVYKIKK